MKKNVTPMLKQYLEMKQEVPNTLLLFRLGDFYEVFFEDAKIVASELDLVLTSRAAGNNQKAPMCGVPHHAVSSYLQRLIAKGYKVAIAEQMEDPATTKGLLKRAITKIVTPGLNLDTEDYQVKKIASVERDLLQFHVVIFTLVSNHLEKLSLPMDENELFLTLLSNQVVEVVLDDQDLLKYLNNQNAFTLTTHSVSEPTNKMEVAHKRLLSYLEFTQKQQVEPIEKDEHQDVLQIDYMSSLNLELSQSQRHKGRKNTLWSFLDKTNSVMGSRRLRDWIHKPLYNKEKIIQRQEKITYLIDRFLIAHQVSEQLKKVSDVHKITTKISYGNVNAQDLVRLKQSLLALNELKDLLKDSNITEITEAPDVNELIDVLEKTLVDEPPLLIKDGSTIKSKVNDALDELRGLMDDSQTWLLEYEQEQKQKTGIKNLKVGYSRTFGYYLEVSKSQVHQVQEDWGYQRRQTLTGGQRYITMELKQQEDKITSASDKIMELETQIFNELVTQCQKHINELDEVADRLSDLDVLTSLSVISSQKGYVRPLFVEKKTLDVKKSVHPILEMTLKSHEIIANDIVLDKSEDVMLLTGPNMGGKSTYMRQIALLVIMAQMGCYVRAKKAQLPLFDAIYTRMGASDDILMGQSTFMIEMNEANTALRKATPNSLILFDELGRGTSTYDGMAIAQAIIEYIASEIKAKCVFSTHYHELTNLDETHPNVVNYKVDVLEEKDKVTFLYQVIKGKADKSYGIHVAKLAHLPYGVITNAQQHLKHFLNHNGQTPEVKIVSSDLEQQLVDVITSRDINETTPLEAHQILNKLINLIEENDYE